jgi:hypothetical protein
MTDEKELFVVTPENVPTTERAEIEAKKEAKSLGLTTESTKTINGLINRAIFWGGHILLWGVLIVLGVRILHLILPDNYHWLTEVNLKEIDHILLGLMSGLVTRFWPSIKKDGE